MNRYPIEVTHLFADFFPKTQLFMFASTWFKGGLYEYVQLQSVLKHVNLGNSLEDYIQGQYDVKLAFDYSSVDRDSVFYFCVMFPNSQLCCIMSEKKLLSLFNDLWLKNCQAAIDTATQPYRVLRISKDFGL